MLWFKKPPESTTNYEWFITSLTVLVFHYLVHFCNNCFLHLGPPIVLSFAWLLIAVVSRMGWRLNSIRRNKPQTYRKQTKNNPKELPRHPPLPKQDWRPHTESACKHDLWVKECLVLSISLLQLAAILASLQTLTRLSQDKIREHTPNQKFL